MATTKEQRSDETAESDDVSELYIVDSSTVRKKDFVILSERPCKILEISMTGVGKHGHRKLHLVGQDVFTGKKYEDLVPVPHNMNIPQMVYMDYQLINISDDNFLTLLAENGDIREDIKMPAGDLRKSLRADFTADKDLVCTVLKIGDEVGVVAFKENE